MSKITVTAYKATFGPLGFSYMPLDAALLRVSFDGAKTADILAEAGRLLQPLRDRGASFIAHVACNGRKPNGFDAATCRPIQNDPAAAKIDTRGKPANLPILSGALNRMFGGIA